MTRWGGRGGREGEDERTWLLWEGGGGDDFKSMESFWINNGRFSIPTIPEALVHYTIFFGI